MLSCAICKKFLTTGIVLCGHCAKGLAPYTLPTELAWFIDRLSEKLAQDDNLDLCSVCALRECTGRVTRVTCRNGVRVWLLSRANEFSSDAQMRQAG